MSPFLKAVCGALADSLSANKAAIEADAVPAEQAAAAYVVAQAEAVVSKLPPLEAAVLKAVISSMESQAEPFVAAEVNSGVDAVVAWLRAQAA
jgi:hypothetical protein